MENIINIRNIFADEHAQRVRNFENIYQVEALKARDEVLEAVAAEVQEKTLWLYNIPGEDQRIAVCVGLSPIGLLSFAREGLKFEWRFTPSTDDAERIMKSELVQSIEFVTADESKRISMERYEKMKRDWDPFGFWPLSK